MDIRKDVHYQATKYQGKSGGVAGKVQSVGGGCGLEQDTADHVPELEWDLDLLLNTLRNPRDSGPDMEDENSTLSTHKPKLRLFFEGLAHSSSQTQTEASTGPGDKRSLQSWPKCKKTREPSGIKQPRDSVSDSAAHSTPSPKVA